MGYRYAPGLLALDAAAQAQARTCPARAIQLLSPFPPVGFAALTGDEMAKWGTVVRAAGVQPE